MSSAEFTANSIPIANQKAAGFVLPYVGRTVCADVVNTFGMPLILKGEVITQQIAERAQYMGRLFELIAATEG